MVKLLSQSNDLFDVPAEVLKQSEMLKNMLEDTEPDEAIPLPSIKSGVLGKLLEWCTYHTQHDGEQETDGAAWDEKFVCVDKDMLFDILLVRSRCFSSHKSPGHH